MCAFCGGWCAVWFVAGEAFDGAEDDEGRRFVDVFCVPREFLCAFVGDAVLQVFVKNGNVADGLGVFPAGCHLRGFHDIFDFLLRERFSGVFADASSGNQTTNSFHLFLLISEKI